MKFETVRDAARLYIDLGFRVVPLYGTTDTGCRCGNPQCQPRDWGKHEPPETDGHWKEGSEFGPDDFAEDQNIGLAMGPWGGSDDWLVALDIDGEMPFRTFFYDDLPETLWQKSPRGRHLIYTVPAYSPLGNWLDILETKHSDGVGIDLRYARGRIVAAPSRGAFGEYVWGLMREPAPLPEGVVRQILERRELRGLPVQERWDRGKKRP
jgi:hypothetical protein